jgi:TetR/AcrR family transcriptional regulator, transcriptional repressor of bet genes
LPKLGMGPIRREQICRAAAAVIAREGFAGSTMRMVADEAGVSTGMINHYFANRQDLLTQALLFVSERTQDRYREALEGIPAGVERLNALLDSALSDDPQMRETWYVWINAYGEAVRLAELRHTMEQRLQSWYEIIDLALEGLVGPAAADGLPWSWRLDALLNGLTIQALTSEAALDSHQIREEIVHTLLGGESGSAAGSSGAERIPVRG